jgi:FdhD protein
MNDDLPKPALRGRRTPNPGVGRLSVHRFVAGPGAPPPDVDKDHVAVEQPLELRVAGNPLSLTMRTPGDDVHLALGFLFAEGVIASRADVGKIVIGEPSAPGLPPNVVDVHPADGVSFDPARIERTSRGTLTTASCGVCGRRTIADLLARVGRVGPGPVVGAGVVVDAFEKLRAAQETFAATGGVHGAAALDADGTLLVAAEDVGRHNAVDKVVGALLGWRFVGAKAVRTPPALLVVSGRVSFEMAQKAAAAKIPIIAGVSAPTTLAVELAGNGGLTLVGFVRGRTFNVYANPERIDAAG